MKTWKLNADGDLDLTNGSITVIEGAEYVQQKVSTRLKFLQGEWFLDTRLGFPYFQEVLGKKVDFARLTSMFRSAIENIPDVLSVDKVDVTFDSATRQVSVDYLIRTTTGERVQGGVPFIII